MASVLSALTGISLSFVTIKEILRAIKPWGDQLNEMCFDPTNNDIQGNLRVVYTGFSSPLDRGLCVLVNTFQSALHDILGAPITTLLLATFGTMIVIMAFEGTRKGFSKTSLALFPLIAFSANLITFAAMFALIWAPLYLYHKRSVLGKKDHSSVTLPQIYGAFLAIIFGYGLPTAFMLSPLVQPNTKLEQDVIALWQFVPLLVIPLVPFFTKLFQQLSSPIDKVSDKALRDRLYVAEGKDALEKSYLVLGIVNMLIYFGMYLTVALQGIHIWDSLVLLYRAPDYLPASITFNDLGHILSTRTMAVDLVAFCIGFVLWALFDRNVYASFTLVIAMPIIGPAAAISFYAYYRENASGTWLS